MQRRDSFVQLVGEAIEGTADVAELVVTLTERADREITARQRVGDLRELTRRHDDGSRKCPGERHADDQGQGAGHQHQLANARAHGVCRAGRTQGLDHCAVFELLGIDVELLCVGAHLGAHECVGAHGRRRDKVLGALFEGADIETRRADHLPVSNNENPGAKCGPDTLRHRVGIALGLELCLGCQHRALKPQFLGPRKPIVGERILEQQNRENDGRRRGHRRSDQIPA